MADVLQTAAQAPEKKILEQAVEVSADDIESRYQLGAVYLVNDEYIPAMDQLLEILRRQREYKDDIALKAMVSILNILGSDTDLARSYRQKMIDALST
jgi:putative thioredoxin